MAKAHRPLQPAEPLPRPVVDAHCHLDWHDRDLQGDEQPAASAALAQAAAVGVTRIVQVGCDVASSQWSAQFAAEDDRVVAAVAMHPNDAARLVARCESDGTDPWRALDSAIGAIADLAGRERVRAIGETGLDTYRTGPEGQHAQQVSFREHIALAKAYDKALVIHDRDAHEEVLDVLSTYGAPSRVVFHCFSGDASMARTCADAGWYMSFAGVISYPANSALREALLAVPDDLLLVETDAPYLTAVPNRGKPNSSALMPWTVRSMAQVRGQDVGDLCDRLWDNAMRAFGSW